uniref:Uncharacterized protein n=1 Tax=Cacopsylla melanoneura TaxID=428564 RepID=A0A8D9BIA4_9HEMI
MRIKIAHYQRNSATRKNYADLLIDQVNLNLFFCTKTVFKLNTLVETIFLFKNKQTSDDVGRGSPVFEGGIINDKDKENNSNKPFSDVTRNILAQSEILQK